MKPDRANVRPPRRGLVRELSDAVNDGAPVDWEAELSARPREEGALRSLRQLEAVARAHRAIASALAGPPAEPHEALPAAVYWGPLRLAELVGQGAFGDVYRAIDTRLQREVAVKLRRLGFTDSEEGARRFLDEARRLARVRHPNVLTVHGADVHDRRVGFWTDFVRGETLEQRLRQEGPFGVGEAVLVGLSVCSALAAVHAAGFVHGDVKAANVMREAGGRIVLMDFGAAHWRSEAAPAGADGGAASPGAPATGSAPALGDAPDSRTTGHFRAAPDIANAAGPAFGTPLVLSPELVRGEAARAESDLYAVGALLFRLVTGRYPVEAASWAELREKHARRERTPLRDLRPDLPADFVQAVERALAPEPEGRFHSAGEMERALFAALPLSEVPRDQVRSLRSLCDELGALPEEMCRRIGSEAARALARIHADGRALGAFEAEGMLLLGNGSVTLLAPAGGRAAPAAEEERAARQWADLRRLGEILYRAATGGATLSPFFLALVGELAQEVPAADLGARALASVLAEGERSAWWRERVRAQRRAARPPQRRIRISRAAALQGRAADLQKLRAAWDRARAGDGQVLLLQGEAGIGKTRLVDELAAAIERAGEEANVLYGSYPPGGAATEAGAFLAAYREHFGECGLEESIAEALASAPRLAEPFAALLRGADAPAANALTKDSLQTAFVLAARALAAERPTIILIDDLHFAPEEGLSLFTALALGVPGHRLLLIGAARPELPEPWTAALLRSESASLLALSRLGGAEVAALVADALRSERLAEELAPLLEVRCDGNPLFVLEHLHALEESASIARDADGEWTVRLAGSELPRPESIRHLIGARLAGLEEEDRHLLEIACCCGFEFDPSLVAEAAGLPVLGTLRRFGLLEKRHGLVRAAGRRYVFDHHQVQETLCDGTFEPLREHYHEAVARALETRERALETDPRTLDGAIVVSLAEHFVKGGKGREAARYLLPALDHLERVHQQGAAAELATRALAASGFPGGAERIPVLVKLASRLEYLGRRDQERAALEELLAVSDAHGDASARARARRMLGWLRIREAKHAEARAVLEEALELARAGGDLREESDATGYLGHLCNETARLEEAEAFFTRSLELARQSGHRMQEIKMTGNLGVVAYGRGRKGEAQAIFERHLAMCREEGYRLGEAISVGNLGVLHVQAGRREEAREHYERHLELAREVGFRQAEAIATGNLGGLDYIAGRFASALLRHERMLRLSTEIGFRMGEASAMAGLGLVLGALGRRAEARGWQERRLALVRELRRPDQEGEALLWLGDFALDEGDRPEAERRYREALALWEAVGYRPGIGAVRGCLGAMCRESSRPEEAAEHLAAALAAARDTDAAGALVAASIEWALLRPEGVQAALDAYAEKEPRLSHLERTHARFRLFRLTGDAAQLKEARRLLAELRDGAPEGDRARMVELVPLYRDILAAEPR